MRRFGSRLGRNASLLTVQGLNLTPMIDVMTIIMIFLVKSYSVSPEYLSPAKDVHLSVTRSDQNAPDRAVLIIGDAGILVEDELVISFHNHMPSSALLTMQTVPQLEKALRRAAHKMGSPKNSALVIQANRQIALIS